MRVILCGASGSNGTVVLPNVPSGCKVALACHVQRSGTLHTLNTSSCTLTNHINLHAANGPADTLFTLKISPITYIRHAALGRLCSTGYAKVGIALAENTLPLQLQKSEGWVGVQLVVVVALCVSVYPSGMYATSGRDRFENGSVWCAGNLHRYTCCVHWWWVM